MKIVVTFLFSIFLTFMSNAQSFTLVELIKMSKMNVDDFDSFVTSKGYGFNKKITGEDKLGLSYSINSDSRDIKAIKYITLYQVFGEFRFAIHYQTSDKKEYTIIKKQLNSLGFALGDNMVFKSDDGNEKNGFYYFNKKLSGQINIYNNNNDTFEIYYFMRFK